MSLRPLGGVASAANAIVLMAIFSVGAATSPMLLGQDPAISDSSPADQAASPPAVAPSPDPGSSVNSGAAEASDTGNTGAALDYLFNRKPQDGTAAQQAGRVGQRMEDKAQAADALGLGRNEDPAVRNRFETYLSMEAVPEKQLEVYEETRQEAVDLLRNNELFQAWEKLYALAEYRSIDAGVSQELANRIEAIWNSGRATVKIDRRNEGLRNEVKRSNRNADVMSDRIRQEEIKLRRRENERQKGQGGNSQNNGGVPMADPTGGVSGAGGMAGLEGKLQLTEEYLTSLEAKARIKFNELKAEKLLDQAKLDFADYIGTLYGSGRYQHVVLAADFYRKIFRESEYPVAIANQVNASLERARDVRAAVEVFQYKAGRGELAAATDRLQEAFMASEFHPAVLNLDRKLKEKAATFIAKLDRMQNLMEARDFGTLESVLQEMKETATDFDASKPMAMVNAVKLESRLRLGKAKLAAQSGDLKAAMEEFQAAAQAWPGNPALEDSSGTFFDSQDLKTQSVTEFDRLVEAADYRAIFEKQLAFAPAIRGDEKREEALKQALLKIKDAETASEKASALLLNGDTIGAWETVELASLELPDDKKLNKLRADLSGRSAEFASMISRAKEAEAKSELGYSLTLYVNAQRQYPPSRMANEAIERLSGELLGAGTAPLAGASAAADSASEK